MEKAMTIELLLAWWNLIYIVPFILALMYLGLFVFTGITFGDADADVDMDADVDADADMDADADADADSDAGIHHDVSHADAGTAVIHAPHHVHTIELDNPPAADGHASPISAFLSFLGLGKIPISLALMIFMFIWGITGFAFNAILTQWLGLSAIIGAISIPVTLVITVALTGAFAALLARIIPPDEGKHERRSDLVGKSGEAMYDIDETFGMAAVRGDAGDLFQIPCRTAPGAARIAKGTRIVIFDYLREKGVFHVAPFDA
jgi:membrane protein implicated in regulation of membrane protease activity